MTQAIAAGDIFAGTHVSCVRTEQRECLFNTLESFDFRVPSALDVTFTIRNGLERVYVADEIAEAMRRLDWVGSDDYPRPKAKKIYLNDPVTVVIWEDGTKTISRCFQGDKETPPDEYDPYYGVAVCAFRKVTRNRERIADWEESIEMFADALKHGNADRIRKWYRRDIAVLDTLENISEIVDLKPDDGENDLEPTSGEKTLSGSDSTVK